MKKMFLIPLAVVALVSCSTTTNKKTMNNKRNEMVKVMDDYMVHFITDNGEKVSIKVQNDEAILEFSGEKYKLHRIVSASGEMFNSKDNKIQFGMKGKEGYIEINGKMHDLKEFKQEIKKNKKVNEIIEISNSNYIDEKGEGYLLSVLTYSDDTALVNLNGKNVRLKRIVSASGEAFSNEDRSIYLATKGNEAYLEISGKGINFKDARVKSNGSSLSIKKAEVMIYNFKNENSQMLLAILPELENGYLKIDGKEYDIYRVKSASGVAYQTKDKKIYVGIMSKNNKTSAILEMNGKVKEYIDNGTQSLNYAK